MYEAMIYMCEPETDLKKKTTSLHMKSPTHTKKKRQTQYQLYNFCEISGHLSLSTKEKEKKKCTEPPEVGRMNTKFQTSTYRVHVYIWFDLQIQEEIRGDMHEILGTKYHASMHV